MSRDRQWALGLLGISCWALTFVLVMEMSSFNATRDRNHVTVNSSTTTASIPPSPSLPMPLKISIEATKPIPRAPIPSPHPSPSLEAPKVKKEVEIIPAILSLEPLDCNQFLFPDHHVNIVAPKLKLSIHSRYDLTTRYINEFEIWDSPVSNIILHLLRNVDPLDTVFIDIGSFTGYYSMLFAKSRVTVYSFEGFTGNAHKTCESAMLNGIQEYINVHNFVLTNHNRKEHWCAPEDNSAFSIQRGCPKKGEKFFSSYTSQIVTAVAAETWFNENIPCINREDCEQNFIVRVSISEGFEEGLIDALFLSTAAKNIHYILLSVEWTEWEHSPDEWIQGMLSNSNWKIYSNECLACSSITSVLEQGFILLTRSSSLCSSFKRGEVGDLLKKHLGNQ